MSVAAHVIVEDLAGSDVTLNDEDAHHLASALRLREGEEVGATDGRGGYLRCRYAGRGRLEPAGDVVVSPPPVPELTVGFVPVKGDRPDWAVQKLTELGVDRILLLSSERSVVRWDGDKAASHVARLARVARAALMQSRQVWLPSISGPWALADALGGAAGPVAGLDGGGDGPGGTALADMVGGFPRASLHTLLVGPEGGWSDTERELASATGGGTVRLGSAVLRAETAAVAAGVLLTALRSGLVAPA